MTPRTSLLRSLFASLALLIAFAGTAQADKFLDAVGAADKAILKDLYDGRIIEARPFGAQQNTGSLWKVKIEHEGRVREAIFKPRTFGDRDGWARTPMEAATYKLNRILGMDVVPPTAYRKNMNLNGQNFAEGALMLWVDDSHPIHDVAKKLWKPKHEPFASDLRVLQMLGRDADHENANNIIRGKHWKDGKYRVMKIDNEAMLRPSASVELHYNSAIWGKVTRFNPTTYAKLKALDFNHLKGDIGEHVSDGEIRQMLATRDRLVAHIDGQVRERGADKVFFTPEEVGFNASRASGRKAKGKDLVKFEKLMKAKGVKVVYVKAGDKSLKGGVGRTVLGKDGKLVVRIARGRSIRMGTLVEELVHVNQLRRMGKQTNGLQALHAHLLGAKGRVLRASMEAHAKGLVKLTTPNKREAKKVAKAQRKEQRKVVKLTGGQVRLRSASHHWSHAFRPAPRALRPAVRR